MAMKKVGDVVASSGEYTDGRGEIRKRWARCGVLMRDDDSGRLSIKIDTLPVRSDWSGWMNVFLDDDADGNSDTSNPVGKREGAEDDSIPF